MTCEVMSCATLRFFPTLVSSKSQHAPVFLSLLRQPEPMSFRTTDTKFTSRHCLLFKLSWRCDILAKNNIDFVSIRCTVLQHWPRSFGWLLCLRMMTKSFFVQLVGDLRKKMRSFRKKRSAATAFYKTKPNVSSLGWKSLSLAKQNRLNDITLQIWHRHAVVKMVHFLEFVTKALFSTWKLG